MTVTDINQFIEKYMTALKAGGYSPSTIKSYTRGLKKFTTYLSFDGISEIDKVTREIISKYQIYLYQEINKKGRQNTIHDQNKCLGSVKCFFRYLSENDYLIADPARKISFAKEPKRLPRSILTRQEMKKILKTPDTTTIIGYRNRTILELLYTSGIRRQEVLNLTIDDVYYKEGIIKVKGKGNKERMVPIGKVASRYLENYIKAIRPAFIRDPYNRTLFLSSLGKSLSGRRLADIVVEVVKKTKIKKNVTLHTFRHTFATHLVRNNANIRHVQEMLGHESLESTQIYTHVTIMDLKKEHKRCHPRERDKV